MRILLLAGGDSDEREVSLRSGNAVEAALKKAGVEVVRADPAEPSFSLREAIDQIDMVFPILHGQGGEDGSIQSEFEELDVLFLGSDSRVSKLAFDKVRFKQFLVEQGIKTPKFEVVTYDEFAASSLAQKPYVLKPIDGGSSVETYIVRDNKEPERVKASFEGHGRMLLEELIEGDELTVGVVGSSALPVILIEPPAGEEFDYENKYNGKTKEITDPENIAADYQKAAQVQALKIHQLAGLKHLSRTDFILTPDGELYVLETNTMPGLTDQSLLPKAAAAAGISMPDLMIEFTRMIKEENKNE